MPNTSTLRLLAVLAHPDDEALGAGGTLAYYASQGIETYLVTATRGERGWAGPPEQMPSQQALGELRTQELLAAAQVLGIRQVSFLDYIDGDLDQADPAEAIAKIAARIRDIRPQVVITFDPTGAYGHPDHIAICQFTSAALICAADASYILPNGLPAHRVDKLYYSAISPALKQAWLQYFGDIAFPVDGVTRGASSVPDWSITTRLDSSCCWQQTWQAIGCHRSQVPNHDQMEIPLSGHLTLWGTQEYWRIYSTVNGGRKLETDLFEGLR